MDDIYTVFHKFEQNNSEDHQLKCLSELWSTLEKSLAEKESSANELMYSGLIEYLKSSHKSWSESSYFDNVCPPVTTAVLSTGVNTPDHEALFSTLKTKIHEEVTTHVASLSSSNCGTFKALMQQMVSQFITAKEHANLSFSNTLKHTFSCLEMWYSKLNNQHDPDHNKSSLVVILEDVESFSGPVLHQFIESCAAHASKLPVVLVFGLSTNMEAIRRLLGSEGCVNLSMERFASLPPAELLNAIVELLFCDTKVAFRLGIDVFKFLLIEMSLYRDFSVKNFLHRYKYCLMDHIHNKTFAKIILATNYEQIKKSISDEDINNIIKLPSLQSYLETERNVDVSTPVAKRRCVLGLIQEHWSLQAGTGEMVKFLFNFLSCMPSRPMGKYAKDMYLSFLESEVTYSKDYDNAMNYMKTLSKDELFSALTMGLTAIDNTSSLAGFRKNIQSFIEEVKSASDTVVSVQDERMDLLKSRMTRDQLRDQLAQRLSAKRQSSPLQQAKDRLFSFIGESIEMYATWYKSVALHEVFYYNEVERCREALDPCTRTVLHSGLSQPASYLHHIKSADSDTNSVISPDLPDICILYKLHLESSHYINLYDWLLAFCAVIGEHDVSVKKPPPPSAVVQARFMRGVAELQHLGYVKSTKRKIDHVARLTWGAV